MAIKTQLTKYGTLSRVKSNLWSITNKLRYKCRWIRLIVHKVFEFIVKIFPARVSSDEKDIQQDVTAIPLCSTIACLQKTEVV